MQLPIKVALHDGCGCASLQISSSELHARRDGHRHELLEQQLACVRHVHLHTPAHSYHGLAGCRRHRSREPSGRNAHAHVITQALHTMERQCERAASMLGCLKI